MDNARSTSPSPSGSDPEPASVLRFGPYHLPALLGVLPILALAVFSYLVSESAVEGLVDAGNDATATITGALVEREFEHWTRTLTGIVGFPSLRASVASGDVDEVRRRLRTFVEVHPGVDRAFVTDTTGPLWADHPRAPESPGRRFDDRNWYRGVPRDRGPYVSEVYRRNADPRLLVVAVAVPLRDPATGNVSGLMIIQVRLGGSPSSSGGSRSATTGSSGSWTTPGLRGPSHPRFPGTDLPGVCRGSRDARRSGRWGSAGGKRRGVRRRERSRS